VHTAARRGKPNRGHTNQEVAVQIKSKDAGRKWLWGFLAVIALAQLYFVRELAAAFALFAIGFAAAAFVVGSLHMLLECAELALARITVLRQPVGTQRNPGTEGTLSDTLISDGLHSRKA
jgi:hypothetical protein